LGLDEQIRKLERVIELAKLTGDYSGIEGAKEELDDEINEASFKNAQ
jgi:hypothetical protein